MTLILSVVMKSVFFLFFIKLVAYLLANGINSIKTLLILSAGSSIVILLSATTLIVIMIEIFMPSILALLAPGFVQDQSKFMMLIFSARIIFPFLILVSIVSILSSILEQPKSYTTILPFKMMLFLTMD